MNVAYHYTGCFVDAAALLARAPAMGPDRLGRLIRHPHVTFAYRPESVDEGLFGTPVTLRVTGYGCDGKNEGFRVEVLTDCAPLAQQAAAIEVPHITLSVGVEEQAVNTRWLVFAPVEPFEIESVYGGYLDGIPRFFPQSAGE